MFSEVAIDFKMNIFSLLNKEREFFQYKLGDLVHTILLLTSQIRTSFRKESVKYVGPVVVDKSIDPKLFLLCTLDGKLLLGLFEHERLKPAVIRTSQGNFNYLTSSVETSFACRYQIQLMFI